VLGPAREDQCKLIRPAVADVEMRQAPPKDTYLETVSVGKHALQEFQPFPPPQPHSALVAGIGWATQGEALFPGFQYDADRLIRAKLIAQAVRWPGRLMLFEVSQYAQQVNRAHVKEKRVHDQCALYQQKPFEPAFW